MGVTYGRLVTSGDEGILSGEKFVIRRTGADFRGCDNHSVTYGAEKMGNSMPNYVF